jgi:8-oxo-dGTP diphosphatase
LRKLTDEGIFLFFHFFKFFKRRSHFMANSLRGRIQVACGIIERNGLVLAAQRSDQMSMPLKWEFPGGKIHPDESPEKCLQRELLEELSVNIRVSQGLPVSEHDYPSFHIALFPFICEIASGALSLNEHAALAWLHPERLDILDWAAADMPIVKVYLANLAGNR